MALLKFLLKEYDELRLTTKMSDFDDVNVDECVCIPFIDRLLPA